MFDIEQGVFRAISSIAGPIFPAGIHCLVARERAARWYSTPEISGFWQLQIERTGSEAMPVTGAQRCKRVAQASVVSTRCWSDGASQPRCLLPRFRKRRGTVPQIRSRAESDGASGGRRSMLR